MRAPISRRSAAWAVPGAVAAFAAATARLLLWPTGEPAGPADAVLVLGPSRFRLPEAQRLVEEGLAPVLVVSVDDPPGPSGPPAGPAGAGWQRADVKAPNGVEVLCFRPAPFTTRGEARHIGRLARERGWSSVIVVSSVPQATRAGLRVRRCFPGRVTVVGVGPHRLRYWAYDVVYEWGALAKAVVWERGC